MPRLDFSKIEDPEVMLEGPIKFVDVPAVYHARVVSVDERKSERTGTLYWRLLFKVVSGLGEGKFVRDTIFFTEKGLSRVKLICRKLGFRVEGVVDLTPELLVGREVMLDCEQKPVREWVNKDGETVHEEPVEPKWGGYKELAPPDPRVADTEFPVDDSEIPF